MVNYYERHGVGVGGLLLTQLNITFLKKASQNDQVSVVGLKNLAGYQKWEIPFKSLPEFFLQMDSADPGRTEVKVESW
jgi:hypothetical protein